MTNEEAQYLHALLTGREIGPDEGIIPWSHMHLTNVNLGEFDFEDLSYVTRKKMFWDLIPDRKAREWAHLFEILPGSEEGDEMEKAQATARRNALFPIAEEVTRLAALAGEIISRAKMVNSEGSDSFGHGDTLVRDPEVDYTPQVMAGTMAVLANLLDLELITYGKAVTGE